MVVALLGVMLGIQTLFLGLWLTSIAKMQVVSKKCKTDLMGWQILDYVLFVSFMVLLLAGRLEASLIFMAISVFFFFRLKRIQGQCIYEDLKEQDKLDYLDKVRDKIPKK